MSEILSDIPFHDKQQSRLKRLKESLGEDAPEITSYIQSGHEWNVMSDLLDDIKKLFTSSGYGPRDEGQVLGVLKQLNDCGGKLADKGTSGFTHTLMPLFREMITQAKGLRDQETVDELQARIQAFFDVLGWSYDLSVDEFVAEVSSSPEREVSRFLDKRSDLKSKIEDLLKALVKGEEVAYSEARLSLQSERDFYFLVWAALTNSASHEPALKETLAKHKQDVEANYYILPHHIAEVLEPIFQDEKANLAIWRILTT